MTESTLEELVLTARGGDSGALAAVIAKMLPALHRAAARAVCPGLDFDDAVQEGLIGLFHAIQTFDEQRNASFRTYGGVCVQNAVATAGRRARAKKHSPLSDYLPIDGELTQMGPEDMAIENERYEAAVQSIERLLSPFEKQVLHLHMEGHSYGEIARLSGRSEKSVDNAMQRLRRKLKQQ